MDGIDGIPIELDAGLWFRYGMDKRPEVLSKTTFDAVLYGERTSTTRFLSSSGHAAWQNIQVGHIIRFFEDKEHRQRWLLVEVLSIEPLSLWQCDDAILEEWSRKEGWLPRKGREMGGEKGDALWIKHRLIYPEAKHYSTQLTLF